MVSDFNKGTWLDIDEDRLTTPDILNRPATSPVKTD